MPSRNDRPLDGPNGDSRAPGQPLPQKLQGDQGEVQFEALLEQKIPLNYEREQAHGSHRPDFVLTDDAGDRIAVIDSKTGAWADREQARAFLELASECEPRTLMITTPDGTDDRFSRAVKAELRDQPTIPAEKRVEVIVDTPERVVEKCCERVQQANERLQERERIISGPEQSEPGSEDVQQRGVSQSELQGEGAGGGPESVSGHVAEPVLDPSVLPDGFDIPPSGNAA